MIDLKWVRENPDAFDKALRRRGMPAAASRLVAIDRRKREVEARVQSQVASQKRLSQEAFRVHRGDLPPDLSRALIELKREIKDLEEQLQALDGEVRDLLATFPNVLADDVPEGPDESHNRLERRVGEPRAFAFAPLQHDELGARLGMDFEAAAKLSGARFVVLRGGLARLERALAAFMLDLQTGEHGYTEAAVPYLVRDAAVFGTGQLPKSAEDMFRTTGGHWLIPTSEVPLTNLVAGEILDEGALPIRLTACTPCFRSEAGAAGRDTRGMIRQHQFTKVELVSVTLPERSEAEHERMVGCAEAVLQRLELPYRVVTLCAGDTGFSARKTYDIEVWLPGQGAYREISSCSNCGDFQARRMGARYRPKEGKGTRFIHTLNGSGVAVGRALIAVLENYQEGDGSVTIPAALRPYMRGQERLVPDA
jgi:seryl-tRNA synthetase